MGGRVSCAFTLFPQYRIVARQALSGDPRHCNTYVAILFLVEFRVCGIERGFYWVETAISTFQMMKMHVSTH